MRIFLIRHGETDWNKALRLQGREDIELNTCGLQQADDCGKAFRDININKIISSPLKRAKKTAEIIGKQLGISEILVEEDLIERDFGDASGLTYQEKNHIYGDGQIPGFEPAEQVLNRMMRVIYQYESNKKNEQILLVSHGAAIKTLLKHIMPVEEFKKIERLKNACISILDVTNQKIELLDYNLDADEFQKRYR